MSADQTDTLHADGSLTLPRPRKPQPSTGERARARCQTHRRRGRRTYEREHDVGKRRHHQREGRPDSPPNSSTTADRPLRPDAREGCAHRSDAIPKTATILPIKPFARQPSSAPEARRSNVSAGRQQLPQNSQRTRRRRESACVKRLITSQVATAHPAAPRPLCASCERPPHATRGRRATGSRSFRALGDLLAALSGSPGGFGTNTLAGRKQGVAWRPRRRRCSAVGEAAPLTRTRSRSGTKQQRPACRRALLQLVSDLSSARMHRSAARGGLRGVGGAPV